MPGRWRSMNENKSTHSHCVSLSRGHQKPTYFGVDAALERIVSTLDQNESIRCELQAIVQSPRFGAKLRQRLDRLAGAEREIPTPPEKVQEFLRDLNVV